MAQLLNEITLPELCGGLNTNDPEYEIRDNQSPDMMNLWFKGKALSKRPGQTMVTKELSGSVHRISGLYNGFRAVHAGTKLYKWNGTTATEIKSGLESQPGVFIAFGDVLYYIDGREIWEIEPKYAVSAVVPYAPVVIINCRPDLSESDDNESYNLLGGGFCVKYNGNASSKVYSLPQTKLDAATVKVTVNAVDLTEGTHFTVNRTAGTVNFSGGTSPHGAPGSGTNNVWITAYKTIAGNKEKITGCSAGVPFGGEGSGVVGGTRVFLSANPGHPLAYWRSDLGMHVGCGMRYFPDTSEEYLDQNSDAVAAIAKMGDKLVIFKENSVFAVGYAFDGEDVYYPVRECHSTIGCDMPGSVQLIDNRLVFANTKSGIHMLITMDNELENIIKPLSANINALLLSETGLKNACSCDFDRYYWLCVNGSVYLWDYDKAPYYNYADYDKAQKRLAWYRFNNIKAKTFCADTALYYGSADGIVRFTAEKNDFGQAYSSYFKSKAFDLGNPDELKTFMHVYPSFSTDGNIKAVVTVGNENTDAYMRREFDIRSFDWGGLNWAAFTWNRIKYAQTFSMRAAMRKASYIQVKVSGNEADRGVGLSGLRITYFTNRKVKR
ncbi:MAG: hypothetical protein ACOX8Q_06340 [Christensenellales bacterium]|jgi:hypothetical protein